MRFVPLDALTVHEEDDPVRVARLVKALTQDGTLRNPIIAAYHQGMYVVMDGATRLSALRKMDMQDVLIQEASYSSDRVQLDVWHHVIVGLSADQLLASIGKLELLTLEIVGREQGAEQLQHRKILACIYLPNGQSYALSFEGDLLAQADLLCRMVSAYRGKAQVHRANDIDMPTLVDQYEDIAAVISFPPFAPKEILQIASNGIKVPMGITRHLITGRALGIGVPLSMLTNAQSLAEKNEWIQRQVQDRLRTNKVRLYQEPVFVFDE